MAWTYNGDPNTNEVDAVRFLVGDTETTDQLASDEEIQWFLSEWPDVYEASASLCEALAAKFAREVSVSADGMSFSGDQISRNFARRAEALRDMSGKQRKAGIPYVGGISWIERQKADADSDLIQPSFRSHQHDNPRAGPDDPLTPDHQNW